MGRQGWAFCFGLLVTAAGVAQPPSDDERYPPPPDLPGEVVSQPPASRSIATATPIALRQRAADPAILAPLPKGQPASFVPMATATVAAVPNMPSTSATGGMPAAMGMFHAATNCAPSGCGSCFENFCNWITFRSKPRPSGCYPSPYTPPLQACR